MTAIRVIRAEGDAATRGQQIGRQLGDLIQRSLAVYNRYLERRGVSSADLHHILAPYLAASERALPESMALIKAMAQGAMVPIWELFAAIAFEELEPQVEPADGMPRYRRGRERCSTATVAVPGSTLMGHNEHWLAGDVGNVAVVIEVPDDGPVIASPTVVCCLPAVGLNEWGGAQGIGSLTAADDRAGVPRVLVSRRSLEAGDRRDAVRRAAMVGRAGGYGHVFAFRGGDTFVVETTATHHAVIDGPGAHTNHYLDRGLAPLGTEASAGSEARHRLLTEALEAEAPATPEELMALMRNHETFRETLEPWADQGEGEEASAVVFAMVCDVEAGRMWVAAGDPRTVPYQEIDLTGVMRRT